MSAPKKKCRQYSTEYLKYGFIELPRNKNIPLCLICAKSLSNESMKPPRLMDHLKRIHSDKSDRPVQYFAELKAKYERRVTVGSLIAKATKKNDKGLLASYKVSFLIAKSGKPHTIGEELILPAVNEIVDTMWGPSQASQVIDAVPLSNNTVSLIAKATKKNDKGLLASYKVSFLIAKSGKPHTIGEELILPAVNEIVDTMWGPSQASQVTDAVPLSNNTVSRRIDEMGANVEDVLCNKLKSREFTVQLDESTLSDSTALLQYVRFIDDNGEMAEEMLFVRSLITDTKRSSIFEVIKRLFEEKEIPLLNMIACATDGAAAMTGRHWGFIAHLKQAVPGILSSSNNAGCAVIIAFKYVDRCISALGDLCKVSHFITGFADEFPGHFFLECIGPPQKKHLCPDLEELVELVAAVTVTH
ncbi:zinc finger MYM-type protein 6-like [Diabrotica undecimpunctata]|uniref:zinc finger MYM-type protein 6-like n=1 Tax=Diabrotica undecimpunctata TaxID=50387 RepID=UPI003B63A177